MLHTSLDSHNNPPHISPSSNTNPLAVPHKLPEHPSPLPPMYTWQGSHPGCGSNDAFHPVLPNILRYTKDKGSSAYYYRKSSNHKGREQEKEKRNDKTVREQ